MIVSCAFYLWIPVPICVMVFDLAVFHYTRIIVSILKTTKKNNESIPLLSSSVHSHCKRIAFSFIVITTCECFVTLATGIFYNDIFCWNELAYKWVHICYMGIVQLKLLNPNGKYWSKYICYDFVV